MKVTFYNPTTGVIRQCGDIPAEYVADQLLPGEAFIASEFSAIGFYWNGTAMVAKPPQPAEYYDWDDASKTWVGNTIRAWEFVRRTYTLRLLNSVWSVLPDSGLNGQAKQQWLNYRQALRSVASQPDPLNIVWPTPPAS